MRYPKPLGSGHLERPENKVKPLQNITNKMAFWFVDPAQTPPYNIGSTDYA